MLSLAPTDGRRTAKLACKRPKRSNALESVWLFVWLQPPEKVVAVSGLPALAARKIEERPSNAQQPTARRFL